MADLDGKAWEAWFALQGRRDTQSITDYIHHAGDVLHAHLQRLREDGQIDPVELKELEGIQLFIVGLEMAVAKGSTAEFKLELKVKRRTAGNPGDTLASAKVGRQAAAMVERLLLDGGGAVSKTTAVYETVDHFRKLKVKGASRSDIYKWLKIVERERQAGGSIPR